MNWQSLVHTEFMETEIKRHLLLHMSVDLAHKKLSNQNVNMKQIKASVRNEGLN